MMLEKTNKQKIINANKLKKFGQQESHTKKLWYQTKPIVIREHMSNSNLVNVIQMKILVSTDLSSCPKMDLWQSP